MGFISQSMSLRKYIVYDGWFYGRKVFLLTGVNFVIDWSDLSGVASLLHVATFFCIFVENQSIWLRALSN